jgi:tRNA/rRNA methyltransferase
MISVIFVDPESPGNIGSISRCIKNFGADQLLLVNPCPLAGAQKMAMHATDVLEKAVIVDSLSEALALVDTSIATTSRVSGLARKAITPHELKTVSGHIGIVIGRESHGLTTEEIELCDSVVSIPTSEEYPVLNAALACCILLYELFTCEKKEAKPGTKAQRERLLKECERISNLMEKRPHRKKTWRIAMKRVFSKAFLTDREATILLGFFRRIRTVLELTLSQKC